MKLRTYGERGPTVILVHGGPGAPGSMAPIARELSDTFRVLEPWQRRSGGAPLTVARHVADLDELVRAQCPDERPAVVGSSWGAMLALAWAAAHPERAGRLVLIGCGTFDIASRHRLETTCDARIDADLARELATLPSRIPDEDERLAKIGELVFPLYSYDPLGPCEHGPCDARGHRETWADMLRLQKEGVFPRAFERIDAPVLLLHGAHDPHPAREIRASLEAWLPQLEAVEWERCGHYPWLERFVREEFYATLRKWIGGADRHER